MFYSNEKDYHSLFQEVEWIMLSTAFNIYVIYEWKKCGLLRLSPKVIHLCLRHFLDYFFCCGIMPIIFFPMSNCIFYLLFPNNFTKIHFSMVPCWRAVLKKHFYYYECTGCLKFIFICPDDSYDTAIFSWMAGVYHFLIP